MGWQLPGGRPGTGSELTVTEYLLSIDPGLSTGISLLSYDETSVELVKAWQFSGGVQGFLDWTRGHWDGRDWDSYNDAPNTRGFYSWKMGVKGRLEVDSHTEYTDNPNDWEIEVPGNTTVIAEKFNARNTQGFSYKTEALEPLRVEGAMIASRLMPAEDSPRWRSPVLQYAVGGKDRAEKKRRLHALLKDSGFYVAPKELGTSDADDVRSSIGHALAYLARELKHKPTFELIQGWVGGH